MKPAQIFRQYIWIINTLRSRGRLTFEELSRKWQDEGVADGNPLQRSSFNRHRDAKRTDGTGDCLAVDDEGGNET